MEMNRIDALIANPNIYYDDEAIEGFIRFCEGELTLTDGSDLHLLESFKLWSEQIFGWYYFVERSVYVPTKDNHGGHYEHRTVKKRLVLKQYLIVARGAAKSMYASAIQSYFLNVDTSTTHQITTGPTMKQADEVMSPFRTAITRARGPLFKFLTEGSLQNTTGSRANRVKLAATKRELRTFLQVLCLKFVLWPSTNCKDSGQRSQRLMNGCPAIFVKMLSAQLSKAHQSWMTI